MICRVRWDLSGGRWTRPIALTILMTALSSPGSLEAACTSHDACAVGLVCRAGSCVSGRRCVRHSVCLVGEECIDGACTSTARMSPVENEGRRAQSSGLPTRPEPEVEEAKAEPAATATLVIGIGLVAGGVVLAALGATTGADHNATTSYDEATEAAGTSRAVTGVMLSAFALGVASIVASLVLRHRPTTGAEQPATPVDSTGSSFGSQAQFGLRW